MHHKLSKISFQYIGETYMKRILTLAVLALAASGTAALAAEPAAVAQLVQSCCDLIAGCCGGDMPCCP